MEDVKMTGGGDHDRAPTSVADHWRQSEPNYFKLLDDSPDAIVMHRNQAIVYVNPSALELFGYTSPSEILGRSLFDFVSPAYRALVADRVFQTYFRRSTTPQVEERLLHKSGREVPVEVIAIPFHFGGESGTLVHMRDITERKKLETWLRAEDRLATVGLMAAGIAHEVNNPLTYALCNVDLLRERVGAMPRDVSTAELSEMLEQVREGVSRAAQVARAVTLFAGGEQNGANLVDIHHVLDSCARLASLQLRKRARLVKDYGEVPAVLGHADRLGQVFLNLLTNAAHAIPEGNEAENHVTVRTSVRDGAVIVDVLDTGGGMSREIMAHMFEPLFTTKREGTGLGLSISRALVTEEGGSITAESEVGKGTRFRVVLRAAPTRELRPERPRAHRARSKGKRILIVDDEPNLARVLRLVLDSHVTTVAASGREAVDRLRAGNEYDVILSDLSMGDPDGLALFEQIRAEWPGVESRIVFMSGDAFTPRAAAFFRSVPNAVIEKPFETERLLDVLDSVVESRTTPGAVSG